MWVHSRRGSLGCRLDAVIIEACPTCATAIRPSSHQTRRGCSSTEITLKGGGAGLSIEARSAMPIRGRKVGRGADARAERA